MSAVGTLAKGDRALCLGIWTKSESLLKWSRGCFNGNFDIVYNKNEEKNTNHREMEMPIATQTIQQSLARTETRIYKVIY